MKRFLTLALFLNFIVCGLSAQKNEEKKIESYFSTTLGYAIAPIGNAGQLNVEYQLRNKNLGIGVGFTTEYETNKHRGSGRIYPVGEYVFDWKPLGRNAFDSNEKWFNFAPSLLGYYYLGQKKKWEGFFKTGIVANYNAWYAYQGLEYKTDYQGKVIENGFMHVNITTNAIYLQSINWLIGGGIQYGLNKRTMLRMISEVQWGRSLTILGGVSFKI